MTPAEPRPDAAIIVIGSINVDTALFVPRVPHAGETAVAREGRSGLGGKGANQAVAASRAGGRVRFMGCVGDDPAGVLATERLRGAGVDTSGIVVRPGVPTGSASVWIEDDARENRIVILRGANGELTAEQARDAVATSGAEDVVVVQAEIPADTLVATIRAAAEYGRRIVVNLAPYTDPGDALRTADPLVVNEGELAALLGVEPEPDDGLRSGELDIARIDTARPDTARMDTTRIAGLARSVVVTLGSRGALVVEGDRVTEVPAERDVTVVDTTGAGDAFVGGLAAALTSGRDLVTAARFASRCAARAIGVVGAGDAYPEFGRPD